MALCMVATSYLSATVVNFQEEASEVILHSLKTQPKEGFLRELYTELLFLPVWVKEGNLSTSATELFEMIDSDKTLNTQGKLYQDTQRLKSYAKHLYESNSTLAQKVDLEFKLSQLYEGYSNYHYFGSINWGAFNDRIRNLLVNDVHTEWVLHRPNVDPIALLEKVLLEGEDLKQLFLENPFLDYHYQALEQVLIDYLAIAKKGGFPPISLKTPFRVGRKSQGVIALRERLALEGYLKESSTPLEPTRYDENLSLALKAFQKSYGLKASGVVNKTTLRYLNRDINQTITQLRLNLDRIKWLHQRNASKHIIINIPDFKLFFESNETLIDSMRVIVGRGNHPTPIFSDTVEYIVLNPYWNVPKSIVQKEFIPKLLRDPYAMQKKGIEIRRGWGKGAKLVNPTTVDWKKYRYGAMPFHFAQKPGRRNALGKVKFLFPNKFSVYMHDTPNKRLFKRQKRAFSHGCIRLQNPRGLLKTFASFEPNIHFESAQKVLKGKKKKFLSLKEKVPVDIVYLTAWVDYNGTVQFRDDIYGYDKMQLKSFRRW